MAIFEIERKGEACIILLQASHLEAANAAEFKQALSQVQLPQSGKAVVDCVNLEFIDSSGLGALLHLNNTLHQDVKPLALTNLRPEVLSVVELLRLNTVFKLEH